MLYLLDANVLIDANRDYYPMERVPEFWEWLAHVGQNGDVKIPREIYEEIKDGTDALGAWSKEKEIEAALLLDGDVEVALVAQVTNDAYAPDLTDIEVEKIGRDPFLIAYALADQNSRCVVTTEASKPNSQRANRRVPDICDQFGVPWQNTFSFVRTLNFSTNWKSA